MGFRERVRGGESKQTSSSGTIAEEAWRDWVRGDCTESSGGHSRLNKSDRGQRVAWETSCRPRFVQCPNHTRNSFHTTNHASLRHHIRYPRYTFLRCLLRALRREAQSHVLSQAKTASQSRRNQPGHAPTTLRPRLLHRRHYSRLGNDRAACSSLFG